MKGRGFFHDLVRARCMGLEYERIGDTIRRRHVAEKQDHKKF